MAEKEGRAGMRAVSVVYEPESWSEVRKIEDRIDEELKKSGLPMICASGTGCGQRDFAVYMDSGETVKAVRVAKTIRLTFEEAGVELVSLETYEF